MLPSDIIFNIELGFHVVMTFSILGIDSTTYLFPQHSTQCYISSSLCLNVLPYDLSYHPAKFHQDRFSITAVKTHDRPGR